MLIEYVAYDRRGKGLTGTMEAGSAKVAEDILWQSDLVVTRVRKARKGLQLHTLLPSLFGVKERETIALIRQLATLLDSGLPLHLSLEALAHEKVHPMIKDAIKGIVEHINEGGSFSEGLGRFPKTFPPLFVRLAHIGGQTGDLSGSLRRGADYIQAQAEVKAKLISSLTYPGIVSVIAGISIFVLLNFSIPMLSQLLEEFDADLPLITRMLVASSDFAQAYGLWIVLVVVLSIPLTLLYRSRPAGKLVTDRILLRLPLFGQMVQKSSIARVTNTLASLLSSGIPLLEAVELTLENTDNAVLKDALIKVRSDLLAGSNLSEAMTQHSIFPPLLI